MKDTYAAYVGIDLLHTGTDFAEMITESDPSRILSVYYSTAATVDRYNTFKKIKNITDDSDAIAITADNELTAEALNAGLSGLGEGGSLVLFNGDFYDRILSFAMPSTKRAVFVDGKWFFGVPSTFEAVFVDGNGKFGRC